MFVDWPLLLLTYHYSWLFLCDY